MWQVWVFWRRCAGARLYVLPQRPARAVECCEEPQVELVSWFPNPTVTDEAIAGLPIAMRWNGNGARHGRLVGGGGRAVYARSGLGRPGR